MIQIPVIDDLHVHLRQGDLMHEVVPTIHGGGVGRVLVMPNTSPPITSISQAIEYKAKLMKINLKIEYLMTLFLSPQLTIDELTKAPGNIVGVKSYPKGVTTGSETGVEDYESYFEIFAEMEKMNLSLHLHGEMPGACVMSAESKFLSQLIKISSNFPKLKIVLEHVTTEAAINAVLSCGPNVAATITIHHIDLTISDVVGNNLNFCKPVAKLESDRNAIRSIIQSGNPKFFFGSDSAPHLIGSKSTPSCCPAGIYTQPFVAQYLADAFDRMNCLERLENFACNFGRHFLQLPNRETEKIRIVKKPFTVPQIVGNVVPFRAGQVLTYSIA